ncbi:cadherin-like beta sandwich domain-containing protein [Cohnella sp. GCM10012308]|uniref:cadherin-like beta sandwich domain-containing protein n=1 Tax=Cohnella sp. GCM10012308 TaxID=3317329 RepID=UPI00360EE6BD
MRKINRPIAYILIFMLMTTSLPEWFGGRAYAAGGVMIVTAVGTGVPGSSGDGGDATDAQVNFAKNVALDGSGNLYISEFFGSRVRKVDRSTGKISTVAGDGNFGSGGDGGPAESASLFAPEAIAFDSGGNLYIADSGNHRIRKVDTDGNISTVAGNGNDGNSGDGDAATDAELSAPVGLAIDANDNLYIADSSNNRVRKVDRLSGKISTVAGTGSYGVHGYAGDGGPATDAELSGPLGLAIDSHGNLYIADSNNHVIRKVDLSGDISTVAGIAGSSGFSPDGSLAETSALGVPVGLAFDGDGNLYIALFNDSMIRKIDTSGRLVTVAGNGQKTYSGDGGLPTSAALNSATGVAVDSSGTVYIADSGNNRIRKIVPSNNANLSGLSLSGGGADLSPAFSAGTTNYTASVANAVSSVTLTPTTSDSSAAVTVGGTPVTSGSASGAIGLHVGSNPIPVAVTANDGSTKTYTVTVTRAPGKIITVAGTGTGGFSGDGGLATLAKLSEPSALALDHQGNLYFVDDFKRVRKVDKTTRRISTVAGTGTSGYSGDGDLATAAQLKLPDAIVFDSHDNMYIGDNYGVVRKVDTSGYISTVAGNMSGMDQGDGFPATSARLRSVLALAVDSHDNLYIADQADNKIRKVDASTGIISTAAGDGTQGYSGDGDLATDAQIARPEGIAVDSDDNLYISDSLNNRIRKVNASGYISTVAGGGIEGDGALATLAYLSYPTQLSVDADGNLYITDADESRIRQVDTSGFITTVAGTGAAGYSGDGGDATSAKLNQPYGTAVDGNGYLYIADGGNHRIRRVGPPSHEANLSDLALSGGSLSPAFTSGTTSYTASVANDVDSITVTPTASDSAATVKVDGTSVASGSASGVINLSVGSNAPIEVEVTAQDGTTIQTYTVTVTRAPSLSTNASLSGLSLSSGSLSPAFASGTASYTASVANGVDSITITPTASDSNATVKVNGTPVTNGTASGGINLNVGSNAPIEIEVTAQDGTTTQTYTITVTRAPSLSTNASLSGLSLSRGSLSPAFAEGTTSYTASVANDVDSITVTPTVSDSTATVKVDGTSVTSGSASGAIPLSVGGNPIAIKVTAEDGTTTNTYNVIVTRANGIVTPPATVDTPPATDDTPPASRGPILNEKISNVAKVKETLLAALNRAAPQPFADVRADSWSAQAIQVAQQLGIVRGRSDGGFHGSDSITRAEFVAMVANALHLDAASGAGSIYSDTKDHWAEPAIAALTAAGVVEGVGAGVFKPNQQISRAEISAILARLMVLDQTTEDIDFPDTTYSWARAYIGQMAGADIVKGLEDGKFYPNAVATREQAVTMILRMLTVSRNIDVQLIDV